ncbi:collagen alpha-2(I) chain-like [Tympanuchus pallidicinctus]|uniref:collagen alpha-2(I) chain-like n=1 Tax=Tympanuchus pallidicinctus TaxID=109042 RepID=UPI002286DD43|nr:collagen alpha-2(I) chain-like [Tympanuchus pallidicinctus]
MGDIWGQGPPGQARSHSPHQDMGPPGEGDQQDTGIPPGGNTEPVGYGIPGYRNPRIRDLSAEDLWDLGPLGYGTFGIWDPWDMGPLGYGTFGIWDPWDMGPLGYGTPGIWDLWDLGPLGYGTPHDSVPSDLGPPQDRQHWGLMDTGVGAAFRLLSDCILAAVGTPRMAPRGTAGCSGFGWLWGAVALGGFGVRWLWVLTGGWTGMRCSESRHRDTAAPGAPVPHTWGWGHVRPQGSVTPGCVYGDTSVPKGGASPDLVTGPRLPLAQGHQDSRGDAARPPQPLGAVGTRRWGHARTHTSPLCVLVPTPGLILPLAVPVPTWLSSTPAGSPGRGQHPAPPLPRAVPRIRSTLRAGTARARMVTFGGCGLKGGVGMGKLRQGTRWALGVGQALRSGLGTAAAMAPCPR